MIIYKGGQLHSREAEESCGIMAIGNVPYLELLTGPPTTALSDLIFTVPGPGSCCCPYSPHLGTSG